MNTQYNRQHTTVNTNTNKHKSAFKRDRNNRLKANNLRIIDKRKHDWA